MKKISLSIILPTYNIEKYISECLDSIINQTFKNLEIIIIDDNSTDNTPDIISNYANKDSRIRAVFHKKNLGPGKSRNEGIRLATGKYITFMDHDDWQDLDKYEKMLNKIELSNSQIVFCNAQEYIEKDNKKVKLYNSNKVFSGSEDLNIEQWNKKFKIFHTFTPPWTKIIKKGLIDKYDIKFAENDNKFDDVLFHWSCIVFANKISLVDEVLYTHRSFPESISSRSKEKTDMLLDSLKTWYDLEKICLKNNVCIKKVFSSYIKHLADILYYIKSSKFLALEVKNIIKNINLKKEDLPKEYKKYYKKIMGYSFLKEFLIKLRKKTFVIRIRPKKQEYKIIFLGLRVI